MAKTVRSSRGRRLRQRQPAVYGAQLVLASCESLRYEGYAFRRSEKVAKLIAQVRHLPQHPRLFERQRLRVAIQLRPQPRAVLRPARRSASNRAAPAPAPGTAPAQRLFSAGSCASARTPRPRALAGSCISPWVNSATSLAGEAPRAVPLRRARRRPRHRVRRRARAPPLRPRRPPSASRSAGS